MLCTYNNDGYWELESAFKNLGLNPHSVETGGHNQCYRIEHWNPNLRNDDDRVVQAEYQLYRVGDERYRVSSATLILNFPH